MSERPEATTGRILTIHIFHAKAFREMDASGRTERAMGEKEEVIGLALVVAVERTNWDGLCADNTRNGQTSHTLLFGLGSRRRRQRWRLVGEEEDL